MSEEILTQEPPTAEPEYENKYDALDGAILANWKLKPRDRQKWRVIGEMNGYPASVVYGRISYLRKKGLGPQVSYKGPELSKNISRNIARASTSNINAQELLAKIEKGEVPDEQERRKILGIIIATSTDQYKVSAIKALQDIDAAKDRGIGPPPPFSNSEKVERAAKILKFIGRKLARQAMEAAFGEKTALEVEIALPASEISGNDGEDRGQVA